MQASPPQTPLSEFPLKRILSALHASALFLDFDGTLVDLAPRPEEVVVSPQLIDTLRSLYDFLDGRLAIVSGRPIAQIDTMLSPLILPVAGVHGMERRDAGMALHYAPIPDFFAVQACALRLEESHPTLRVEQKRGTLALHYRQAPELEALCQSELTIALRDCPGMILLHGKMVFEVKPATVTKGAAIEKFLAESPFMGTSPIFAGDDTTDESGFEYVQKTGGIGIKIGEGNSVARYRIASPHALRAELFQLAELATLAQASTSVQPAQSVPTLSKGC
ncbi:trehalose-phosphatase [Glaciimonas immobilis]|nr:trehalose-phosphatase [Glaciimonas immobilis]